MQNIAVIIQARAGSKRLPNKMLNPFINNQNLLEIVLDKFINFKYKVIVATSSEKQDDAIEKTSKKKSIDVFRGSENNVLNRFIETAEEYNIDVVIRVCADNPFISVDYIYDIIEAYIETPKEYISFQTENKTPTIKTHYGFFAELVELKALKKVRAKTNEMHYLEHVTNYIYENNSDFSTRFLAIPFKENNRIRLTLDTYEDFETCQKIYYNNMNEKDALTPEKLVKYINENKEYLDLMQNQIENQKK